MEEKEILAKAQAYIAEEKDEVFRSQVEELVAKRTLRNWKTAFTSHLNSEREDFAE